MTLSEENASLKRQLNLLRGRLKASQQSTIYWKAETRFLRQQLMGLRDKCHKLITSHHQ